MKKFHFNLQSILDYTAQQEEFQKLELYQLLSRHMELQDALLQSERRIQEMAAELSSRSQIHSDEIELYRRYIHSLQREVGRLQKALTLLEQEIRAQRKTLVETSQKRRVYERLREKSYRTYRERVEKAEQREADELYLVRRHHRQPAP